ncbi:MAG: hypothetical protein IPL84_04870 [Chitinophagaceae bacterium]|nr:hypothetical protein [Chitinophagaceae bacterium]
MVLLQCKSNALLALQGINWPAIIASFGTVVAIIFNFKLSKKTLYEKRLEEKRAFMKAQLNEFYAPLILLREKSNKIYEKFREKYVAKDEHFSTLSYLLNDFKFDENDESLLREIIAIGTKCEELIHNNAGLIDDENLRDILIPRATTHFLMIRLAFEKKIKGRSEEFKDLTFPRELDQRLKKRKQEIQNELETLLRP